MLSVLKTWFILWSKAQYFLQIQWGRKLVHHAWWRRMRTRQVSDANIYFFIWLLWRPSLILRKRHDCVSDVAVSLSYYVIFQSVFYQVWGVKRRSRFELIRFDAPCSTVCVGGYVHVIWLRRGLWCCLLIVRSDSPVLSCENVRGSI